MEPRDGASRPRWKPATMRVNRSIASVIQGRPIGFPALFVDYDDIDLGMVDLDDLQRTVRGVFPGGRVHGANRFGLAPAGCPDALIYQQ